MIVFIDVFLFGSADVRRFCLRNGSRRFTRGGLAFQVQETPSAFLRSRNEALTVAMRVNNPDRLSPVINR
jgi:hypothetical protein